MVVFVYFTLSSFDLHKCFFFCFFFVRRGGGEGAAGQQAATKSTIGLNSVTGRIINAS